MADELGAFEQVEIDLREDEIDALVAKVVRRRRRSTLENWEVALVKAMILKKGQFINDQDILAYFTRPTRTVNHRLIAEIRSGEKHKATKPASDYELEAYLLSWPDIDHGTGLSVRGDELLIKAREAMIAGVQTFNSAGLTFRAELFIVTAVIAWTYLLHAWFKREGIDYRYKDKTTKQGSDTYWDLSKCLKHEKNPLGKGVVKNLEFLIEIRNEIEHRSTNRIDDALGAKLQACALNFNDVLKIQFGLQYGLEKRLPLALQFVSFDSEQRSLTKGAVGLPKNVETAINAFENGLSEDQLRDPAYRMSYGFVPVLAKKEGACDVPVHVIKKGSEDADEIEKIILKEVNRKRYTSSKVVEILNAAGYSNFKQHNHIQLWKQHDAKNEGKGYGCKGDYANSWVWFDRWVDEVKKHCEAAGETYR